MGRAKPNALDGQVENLSSRRKLRYQQDAALLEKLAKRAGLPPALAADLAMRLAPATKTEWTFAMISPQQNAAVVSWLEANSKRPMKAMKLWAHLFEVMRSDTGEILRTREELAAKIGMTVQDLSKTMTELASINAIVRSKEGRQVRYFMNPNIATHIPTPEQRREARESTGPLLVLMNGGKATIQ